MKTALPIPHMVTPSPVMSMEKRRVHPRDVMTAAESMETLNVAPVPANEEFDGLEPIDALEFMREFDGFFDGRKQIDERIRAINSRTAIPYALPDPSIFPTHSDDTRVNKRHAARKKGNANKKNNPEEQYKNVFNAYVELKKKIQEKSEKQQFADEISRQAEAEAEQLAEDEDAGQPGYEGPRMKKRQYYPPPPYYPPVYNYPYPYGYDAYHQTDPEYADEQYGDQQPGVWPPPHDPEPLAPTATVDPETLEYLEYFQSFLRGFGIELGMKNPPPTTQIILVDPTPTETEITTEEPTPESTTEQPTPISTPVVVDIDAAAAGNRLMNYEGFVDASPPRIHHKVEQRDLPSCAGLPFNPLDVSDPWHLATVELAKGILGKLLPQFGRRRGAVSDRRTSFSCEKSLQVDF